MTLKCPICQSDTEDIYKGRGDVIVLRCSNPDHGEFEISSTIAQSRRGLPLVGSAHWNEPRLDLPRKTTAHHKLRLLMSPLDRITI
jgi:hypothetical protein